MKALIICAGIFTALLFTTAYAAMSVNAPQKYNFDNMLQEVKGITVSDIATWDTIDTQSLIIKTDANDFYLVVLDQPVPDLPFKDHVDMTLNIVKARPGSDDLVITDALSMEAYPVYKVYRIENLDQAHKITAMITASHGMTPVEVADKYNLDSKLKVIKDLRHSQIATWDTIDPQSLLVKTDTNDLYLVVLKHPVPDLPFKDHVGITLNIARVSPGSNDLVITGALSLETYPVYKIYRVNNLEEAQKIKDHIRKS